MRFALLLLIALLPLQAIGQDDQVVIEDTNDVPENNREPTIQTGQPNSGTITGNPVRTGFSVGSPENDPVSDTPRTQNDKEPNPESIFEILYGFTEPDWIIAFTEIGILVVAIGALVISWKATVLLRGTLEANRILLEQSQNAVAAAERSADSSEAVAQQDRAWISRADRQIKTEGIPKFVECEIVTNWRNSGKSPALGVEFQTWAVLYPADALDAREKNLPVFLPKSRFKQVGVIGPDSTYQAHVAISKVKKKKIVEGEERCFLYTLIKYQTIYGRECVYESVEEVIAKLITKTIRFDRGGSIGPGIPMAEPEFRIHPVGTQQRAT